MQGPKNREDKRESKRKRTKSLLIFQVFGHIKNSQIKLGDLELTF